MGMLVSSCFSTFHYFSVSMLVPDRKGFYGESVRTPDMLINLTDTVHLDFVRITETLKVFRVTNKH